MVAGLTCHLDRLVDSVGGQWLWCSWAQMRFRRAVLEAKVGLLGRMRKAGWAQFGNKHAGGQKSSNFVFQSVNNLHI